jgi:RND family efflux transporter MFP subunit
MKNQKIIKTILLFSISLILAFWGAKFNLNIALKEVRAASKKDETPKKIGQASVQTITEWYEAVGTVRPVTEASIESQITAQVLAVKVRPGNKVFKNQVLISLDNRQLMSRLDQAKQTLKTAISGKEQAKQAIIAAKAAFTEAESDYKRTKIYFESQAATSKDMEKAESVYLQAKAGLNRAKEALSASESRIRQAKEIVKEAEIALGYTEIKAPDSGKVLKRLVEQGDLALPGKPLIVVQTTGLLRLEAYVREGLIRKIKPGTNLKVIINTLNETTTAKVEEIIPYADPQTRTFLVKALLPTISGIYPGMFGKLLIPVQDTPVVVIPKTAVSYIGQLELVKVKENNSWKTRFIKTGKTIGDKIEVLSGLAGNETIGWEE